jgi:uncharacterized membrane protein
MKTLFALIGIVILAPQIVTAGGVPLNQSIFAGLKDNLKLRCFGTEPFWSMKFHSGTKAILTEPSLPDLSLSYSYNLVSGTPNISNVTISTGLPNPPGTATGTVKYLDQRNCSDQMSDFTYPFSISISFSGQMSQNLGLNSANGPLQGCCQFTP